MMNKKTSHRVRVISDGTFVQEQYHAAPPFASFLPGIAGECGIPMWVFYCNRGQAITSCGVRNKDGAIMEFHPANTAYQRVGTEGFRTFIWNGDHLYEPFRPGAAAARQTLRIRPHEIELEERNAREGLRTHIVYFTLPGLPQCGLVRRVTLVNTGRRARRVRIADGMARFVPGSVTVGDYKLMSNTEAGVIETLCLADGVLASRARVIHYDTVTPDFNTSFNYVVTSVTGSNAPRVQMIGDPRVIFGEGLDVSVPYVFLAQQGRCTVQKQRVVGYMPCAFAVFEVQLAAGAACEWISIIGNTASLRDAQRLRARAVKPGWLDATREENARLIAQIQDRMWTVTHDQTFDYYCRQTYLDNVLRGGLPVSLGPHVFHLYFRKHGDMERDYNWFTLDPAYYSQGNANYRDINQNRRADVLFHPPVALTNVRTFVNALQLDGNNPLAYDGTVFELPMDIAARDGVPARLRDAVAALAGTRVTPGQLAAIALQHKCAVHASLAAILAHARRVDRFGGSDGYWSDHWTYCVDLLDNYLQVYPERARQALCEDDSYTFHDNPEIMLPRDTRFTLDTQRGVVRQHNALAHDKEKARLIATRTQDASYVRTQHGTGEVYRTTLFEKLLCLAAVKYTTLDPDELGLEMRGNRPGWNDALNGLPGLIGSSLNETAELLRLVRVLRAHAPQGGSVALFAELAALLQGINTALAAADPLARWHARNDALERYLTATRLGLDGATTTVTYADIHHTLAALETVLHDAIQRAHDARSGLYHGYFFYRVTRHRALVNDDGSPRLHDGRPCVWPEVFQRETLPPFLEPQMRVMTVLDDAASCRALHRGVQRSALYDRTLRMYVLNAPLARTTREIGRANIFPPGWLENQSVWLHMEYKYLLALLRAGLHTEFFDAAAQALIPFQPPRRYGRSPLEHASFIASSAHPDASIHGAGFYARLSGATIEFISMWLEMSGAARMFSVDEHGALRCRLQPVLPAAYFTKRAVTRVWHGPAGTQTIAIPKHACAFVILGRTLLVYHNPLRRDTFGPRAARPKRYTVTLNDGTQHVITGGWLSEEFATRVRSGDVARIFVELG